MKKIQIVGITHETGIYLQFKCGSWHMFTYDVQTQMVSASYKQPKYAGGEVVVESLKLDYIPTVKDAMDITKELKAQFDASIIKDRIAYYQAKLDKLQPTKVEGVQMRLVKFAKQINVGTKAICSVLEDAGEVVENRPTFRVNPKQQQIVKAAFKMV